MNRLLILSVVLSVIWVSACMLDTSEQYTRLAHYLHSQQGFADWQRDEAALKRDLQTAADTYHRDPTIENLQPYDKALREYLEHGLLLYRAYDAANYKLPPRLMESIAARTDELMDIADEYLKQGSTAMGVGIAREVVTKFSDLDQMTKAQRRAEGILLKYRYRQDY
jgi:hypothetical protein